MSSEHNSNLKTPTFIKTKGFHYSLKFFILSILTLLMLIPLLFISSVISDRESYKAIAMSEISSGWGFEQSVLGPIIAVPVKIASNKKNAYQLQYLNFSPDMLDISGDLKPQIKYKGLFKKAVYTSDITLKAKFDFKNKIIPPTVNPKDILWDKAMVTISIADQKGLTDVPFISIANKKIFFEPSADNLKSFTNGIHASLPINPKSSISFQTNIKLNGSDKFSFFPVAKQNKVSLKSNWKDPSFIGAFLPNKKSVNDSGFSAIWNVSYLASNFPQVWFSSDMNFASGNNFGVSLLIPVDSYRNTIRAVTYGILFIALTFIACFIFEIVGKLKIHPFQYGLVGFAMALFYLLLISFSEFIDFLTAYVIASIAITIMITLYSHFAITKKERPLFSLVIFAVLTALYLYLYVLLEAQDTSLLYGSIGLFITLGIIMYVTRNINWYDAN